MEEFCSHLSDILRMYARLQDP